MSVLRRCVSVPKIMVLLTYYFDLQNRKKIEFAQKLFVKWISSKCEKMTYFVEQKTNHHSV